MKIHAISKLPTTVDSIPDGSKGVHESVLRAYNILRRVKEWLERGVPPGVILDLVSEMESGEAIDLVLPKVEGRPLVEVL